MKNSALLLHILYLFRYDFILITPLIDLKNKMIFFSFMEANERKERTKCPNR